MEDSDFVNQPCSGCSGYGAKGNGPRRRVCLACGGRGVVVLDKRTGKIIDNPLELKDKPSKELDAVFQAMQMLDDQKIKGGQNEDQ